jgi:hypothetical protein
MDERALTSKGFFSCALDVDSGVVGAEELNFAAIARARTFPALGGDSAIEARLSRDFPDAVGMLDDSADEIAGWSLNRLLGLGEPELDFSFDVDEPGFDGSLDLGDPVLNSTPSLGD